MFIKTPFPDILSTKDENYKKDTKGKPKEHHKFFTRTKKANEIIRLR